MKITRATLVRFCFVVSLVAIAAASFALGASALNLMPATSFEGVAPHYGAGAMLMLATATILTLVMRLTFNPRRAVKVTR
jgi:hypothetical protein